MIGSRWTIGSKCSGSGFTLIEVLVSMVLVSMITLTMAFALRMTLQTWERGENEGEKLQIEITLPYLLEHQLRFLVESRSFAARGNGKGNAKTKALKLDFFKKDNRFSFYTLYSPRGTPAQGLIRVTYIYNENEKVIKIYEKIIGSQEDINDSDVSFSGSDDKIYPVALITDVDMFKLTFSPERGQGRYRANSVNFKLDITAFQENWENPLKSPPPFVHLIMAQNGRRSGREIAWLFKVGGDIY